MIESSSFRDPSGFVFYSRGVVKRQINSCYARQYESLVRSGLYRELVVRGLLIPHKELEEEPLTPEGIRIIRPQRIPFVSYPYEWSFSMLQEAALATLRIQQLALERGMTLKDASAYNIQFIDGKFKLIDTLSFDFYKENTPWIAYGQFCRHFLAPLLLMCHTDIRLNQLLRIYVDGIPLDLARTLLHGKGGLAAWIHIRCHAAAVERHKNGGRIPAFLCPCLKLSLSAQKKLVDHLLRCIGTLPFREVKTEWSGYYGNTNYSDIAEQSKMDALDSMLSGAAGEVVWDMGANDGKYTRAALRRNAVFAVAFDVDPIAVERNYKFCVKAGEKNLLPLLLDLTNPSPGIGFANRERVPVSSRGRPGCILMLAIIHHLVIANNLPFARVAEWVASLAPALIIEFIPKEDSQVRILLSNRDDIFPDYTQSGFEAAFAKYFHIDMKIPIRDSLRVLYHCTARAEAIRNAESFPSMQDASCEFPSGEIL